METTQLFTFVLASLVIILAPGPDLIFAITTGINESRTTSFFTCLGFALGNLFHLFLFLIGVGVFLKTKPEFVFYIRVLGSVYLIILGALSIRNAFLKSQLESMSNNKIANKEFFFKALFMNILNPKVILFFMAFFPQFIKKGPIDELTQLIILGSTFVFLVFVIFFGLSISFSSMGLKILYRSRIKQYFDISIGILFIGISLKLILTS